MLFSFLLQQEKTGKGLPFPSCSSFLVFLSFRKEQEKRREREGERQNNALRRWHSSLSFLRAEEIGREEGYDEVRQGFIMQVPLLCFIS